MIKGGMKQISQGLWVGINEKDDAVIIFKDNNKIKLSLDEMGILGEYISNHAKQALADLISDLSDKKL